MAELPDPDAEVVLAGGRVTPGVVRVADTVRRPTGAHSPFVHRLLAALEDRGVQSVPRFLGTDSSQREILTFREGWVPPNLEWRRWDDRQLSAAASIVRELHDATEGSDLADGAEVVCHGDLSPCNFVFEASIPVFLIDFDRAHPGSRKSDLAYMAWLWLVGPEDERHAPPLDARLRQLPVLLDAYGLDDRTGFADAIEREQREIRDQAVSRGFESGADWVRGEIEFTRAHAETIDRAVASSGNADHPSG